jgi:hypothetical protein
MLVQLRQTEHQLDQIYTVKLPALIGMCVAFPVTTSILATHFYK